MAMRRFVWISAVLALLVTGCQGLRRCPPPAERVLDVGCTDSHAPLRLDRGDWAVSQQSQVWRVMEAREDRPPEPIGFLVRRTYRQMRGGPAYEIYTVTTLNRREEIGRIDQFGRAWRYEPRRNAGFEEVDLGVAPLPDGVQSIFQSRRAITLVETTERQLAFEALDLDRNGVLEGPELEERGDRLRRGDLNRDGKVDPEEFDRLDVL